MNRAHHKKQDDKPKKRFLNSFVVKPNIRFETQDEDEKVILLLRAHPITQVPWIFNAAVFFLLLIGLNLIFPYFLSSAQIIFTNAVWIIGILSYMWLNFLLYFFTVGLITNKRILDIDFHGILTKEVTETRLKSVEDITSKTNGYIGSLFHFGNVFVQTAGTENNIEFISVPEPSVVVRIINESVPHK